MAQATTIWNPSSRQLRLFGILGAAILATIAWRFCHYLDVGLFISASFAAGLFLIALLAPLSLQPLYVAVVLVLFPIAWSLARLATGVRLLRELRNRRARAEADASWRPQPAERPAG